jgi:4-amino-4-deoxy-L-arabinose transferase-like glycosyltransferase
MVSFRLTNVRNRSVCSQAAVQDCLFLTVIVLVSAILYLPGLGFYSDDWDFLRRFSLSRDQSIGGLFQSAYFPLVRMRPVQIIYLSGLYWLFGLQPLGYHLVNAAILASGIVLLYLVLRELGQDRVLALAVAAVYSLLPCYSEDRF